MVNNEPNQMPRAPRPYKIDDEAPPQQNADQSATNAPQPPPFVYGRATLVLIAINVAVYVLMGLTSGLNSFVDMPNTTIFAWGGNYGPATIHGQWWRLLTAAFIHGGFVHIAVNMVIFSRIGTIVENVYGIGKFLAIYLLSAITGFALSMLFGYDHLAVGASGALLGCVGAFVVFLRSRREELDQQAVNSTIKTFITFVVIILLTGLWDKSVDTFGHIGGFAGGVLISAVFEYRRRKSLI